MKRYGWLLALLALLIGGQVYGLTTSDFSTAVTDSETVANAAKNMFYAVLPIALVIGLVIMGWRYVRRLAK